MRVVEHPHSDAEVRQPRAENRNKLPCPDREEGACSFRLGGHGSSVPLQRLIVLGIRPKGVASLKHGLVISLCTITLVSAFLLVRAKGRHRQLPFGDVALYDYRGRVIPPEGLVENPLGATHPGDVAGGEAVLRRVLQKVLAFRSATGRLPTIPEICGPKADPRWAISGNDLQVPDAQYSDGYDERFASQGQVALAFAAPRPDGKPKPAFPAAGERDIWLATDAYVRLNEVVYRGGRSTHNPQGVHLLLWSDGRIERVPAGKEVYYRDSANSFTRAYLGEAGLPSNVVNEAEVHRLLAE